MLQELLFENIVLLTDFTLKLSEIFTKLKKIIAVLSIRQFIVFLKFSFLCKYFNICLAKISLCYLPE